MMTIQNSCPFERLSVVYGRYGHNWNKQKNRHRGGNHDGGDVNQKKPLKPIYLDIISSPVDRRKTERRR